MFWFYCWFVVTFLLVAGLVARMGYEQSGGDPDGATLEPGMVVFAAFVWPFALAVGTACSPAILAYWLGSRRGARRKAERQAAERAAAEERERARKEKEKRWEEERKARLADALTQRATASTQVARRPRAKK